MSGAAAASGTAYALYGLQVRSPLPLPELPAGPDGPADVVIEEGAVPAPAGPDGYRITERGTVLEVAGIARFLIAGGERIVIEARAGASARNVRLFLLGSAFGALLHQRGLLPLHANAIAIGGGAVAFIGRSGAGKSTLAAWMLARGHAVLADDVCAVDLPAGGAPLVRPGVARLRLWRDALLQGGRDPAGLQPSFDGDMRDKFDLPAPAAAGPLPLRRLYVLGTGDGGGPPIRPLRGSAALAALVENTYRGSYARLSGRAEPHLRQCLRLLDRVELYALDRRWGYENFESEALAIEQHASVPTGAPA